MVSWVLWNTVWSAAGPAQNSEETDPQWPKILKKGHFS